MSVKGISWIEANFEKLIVVIMLLLFLAVLTFQFVLQSNTVEVEGKQYPLAQAFEAAERAAERLQSQLTDDDPQLPSELETRDLAAEFEQAISGDAYEHDRYLSVGEPLSIDVNVSETQFAAGEYAHFEPPAPAEPIAATYRATLDPYAVQEIEGLEQYVPEEQPFDTAWVTVQSQFSGQDLQAAYQRDPDGPGGAVSPMPSSWWASGAGVVEVEVERQRLGDDGEWGPAEAVARMPGITSLTDELDEKATNYRQLQALGAQAASQEQPILRPEFVAILEGEPWVPPSEIPDPDEQSEQQREMRILETRLSSIYRDIQLKEQALTGNTPGAEREREREGRGGGGGDAERRRQSQNENAADRGNQQEDARRASIQRQIDQLNERREQVVAELEDLGWQPDGTGPSEAYDRSAYQRTEPLLEAETVHFWSHDFDVEPGATYRYRTRLVFVNPLFGRKSSLNESLHEYAESKLTRSEWSSWGESVDIGWDEYYFLTGANAGTSALSTASATAELYKFYYGYWRRSQVALEPGDRFIASVDLPDGLQRWDVERPAQEQAWKAPPEGETASSSSIEQPEGIDELLMPNEITVEADSWLLDVVASPMTTPGIGGTTSTVSYEAFIRGPDGRIVSRSPRQDQNSPLYALIESSAELGEDQLPRVPGQAQRAAGGRLDQEYFEDERGMDPRAIEEQRRRERLERMAPGSGGG